MSKRSFKEKTQGMTFSEKAEYLWEYYKWVLLVAAFVVIVMSMVITGIVNTSGEILYSGALVNVQISEDGRSYLTEAWAQQLGAQKKEKVDLFTTSFQDLQNTADVETNSAAAMQVVLMITAEDFDYVLMDDVAFDFYKNHPVFTSLDRLFDAETLKEWEDTIIYHETQEDGRFPIAVDITDTAFVRDCVAEGQRVYVAFPGNTGRTALNDDFLMYLMDWE